VFFFFFKQKTAYEVLRGLVGSEMGIRDTAGTAHGGRRLLQLFLRAECDDAHRPADH